MFNTENNLKDRFLRAVVLGEIGVLEAVSFDLCGVVVSLKAFKFYFNDIKTQYVSSFMPAATFEPGQYTPTHTKFLFRVRKGAYLIHSDVLVAYMRLMLEEGSLLGADVIDMGKGGSDDDSSVKEEGVYYRV